MVAEPVSDVPAGVEIRHETFRQFVGRKIRGDQIVSSITAEATPGFPWTYPKVNMRPIGTLFAESVDQNELKDAYSRYQLARRIVDAPIEESFYQGFEIHTDPSWSEDQQLDLISKAWWLYNQHKFKIARFAKLVRLYGHSELLFGWTDDKRNWNLPPRYDTTKKLTWTYTQPVPLPNETELKVTDFIPIEIEYVSVNFGAETISNIHPSRFLYAQNPKLTEEDKIGESCLSPIWDVLTTQVHADWSIGQNLWRSAGGLLALGGPKRSVKDPEVDSAIASIENHNAKTVIYVPFGWTLKNIIKGSNIAIARTYRVILEQISAGSGIPVSILIGSQRGALAPPDEDKQVYYRMVGVQQETLLTPTLEKFFRNGQLVGYIPPGPIQIKWNKLEAVSELDKCREELELVACRSLHQAIAQNQIPPQEIAKLLRKKRR